MVIIARELSSRQSNTEQTIGSTLGSAPDCFDCNNGKRYNSLIQELARLLEGEEVILAVTSDRDIRREMKSTLSPGSYYFSGDEAIAEGAIAARCGYFAGYPITPASEIVERISIRFKEVGGVFIQMEDEIASICSIIGASWAGARAMTATSGPGFSLMQEGMGHAIMTETPIVIIDVQREDLA